MKLTKLVVVAFTIPEVNVALVPMSIGLLRAMDPEGLLITRLLKLARELALVMVCVPVPLSVVCPENVTARLELIVMLPLYTADALDTGLKPPPVVFV